MYFTLPDFEKAHVLVVGDVMLDRYWFGETTRVSPEAPVVIANINNEEQRAGGAANVALNIAGLGAHTKLFGLVGRDEAHQQLVHLLMQYGIEPIFIDDPTVATITKLRVISHHQQLIRIDFEKQFSPASFQPLFAAFNQHLLQTQIILLSDYAKGTLINVEQYIAAGRQAGIPVFVDPKGTDFKRYKGASLLTPNMREFEAVVGECYGQDNIIVERGFNLINECELDALLVTRGEHGMSLLQRHGHQVLHVPTRAQEVFDVSGAGDTVIATLAATFAAGETLEHATQLANMAAGIAVGRLGTAVVTCTDLQCVMPRRHDMVDTVISEEDLKIIVKEIREHDHEKIVVTNGCFDILHPGHIDYLNRAKELGDRLIVLVNDDESVKRLKGSSRPINSLSHRMAILAGLAAVDWVIPFTEDTPERIIKEILPDVLVKGGDYVVEQIAGHEAVLAHGGQVIILPFVDGFSTTSIIERMKMQEHI